MGLRAHAFQSFSGQGFDSPMGSSSVSLEREAQALGNEYEQLENVKVSCSVPSLVHTNLVT